MNILVCLVTLGTILASSSATGGTDCNGLENYDYPRTDSCWQYQHCSKGSLTSERHWCLPFIRRFSRTTWKCEWYWQADCSTEPTPRPPTQPSWPPTEAPTGPPLTKAPTEPPPPLTKAPTEPPPPLTKAPTEPQPPLTDAPIVDGKYIVYINKTFLQPSIALSNILN